MLRCNVGNSDVRATWPALDFLKTTGRKNVRTMALWAAASAVMRCVTVRAPGAPCHMRLRSAGLVWGVICRPRRHTCAYCMRTQVRPPLTPMKREVSRIARTAWQGSVPVPEATVSSDRSGKLLSRPPRGASWKRRHSPVPSDNRLMLPSSTF